MTKLETIKDFPQVGAVDSVDYVLLLPHNDTRLNTLLCNAFAAKIGDRNGMIVEGGQTDDFIRLYSIYAFTDKLIIGSFEEPYGRKLRNILEIGIATEDELINDVILGAM